MRARSEHSAEAGFTLLELLIVTLMTAMVVAVSFQLFESTRRTFQLRRPDGGRELAAQVFLDRLERELQGTIMLQKVEGEERLDFPWVFVSESKLFDSNESDNIKFITQSPARIPGRDSEGLRLVSYGIETARDLERYDLFRLEESLPSQMEKEVRVYDGDPVLEDIARFELTFNTAGEGARRESWDSTDVAMLDQIPHSVEALLTLYEDRDGELEEGREFRRVITLPVRPFAPPEEDDSDICSDGPSISTCLRQIITQYQPNDATIDQLWELADEAGQGCWYPGQASEMSVGLRRLHQEAERLSGASAEELCAAP